MLVEVDQREGCQQPFVILLDSAITHLGVLEDTLQDAKGHSTLARTRDLLRFLRYVSNYQAAGAYSFTAIYSGDSSYSGGSSNALSYTVNRAPVRLTAPSAPVISLNSTSDIPVTITGQYAGAGILVPGSDGSSTVAYTFYNSSNTQISNSYTATVAADSGNSAVALAVPASVAATAGTYSVTATFNGDSNYLASTSGTIGNSVSVAFTAVAPDFFITVNKPALTIAQGQTAQHLLRWADLSAW